MRRIREHLTYANVMATIAVFIAISGGTAVALNGTNTVQSDDLGPGAQVRQADVADNAVNSADVVNESLTGADIKNRSVDTCQTGLTAKYGPICAGSDGQVRSWFGARDYCAGHNLRLPSFSEAVTLGLNHDVPGVPDGSLFWTDEVTTFNNETRVWTVGEDGATIFAAEWSTGSGRTVCVTDPAA